MNSPEPWGQSAAIDLYGCSHNRLKDPELLKQFVAQVIAVIGMEAHGPCYVDRFGDGTLEGISAMQFIKTSSIAVHCDEVDNRVFIDIFSCKEFDANKALEFASQFFKATDNRVTTLTR